MIPSKRISSCALAICSIAITIATGNAAPNEKVLRIPWRHGGYILISTVDWYKEPPENFGVDEEKNAALLYGDLAKVVPSSFRSEAVAMLASSDVVELTNEQARHFGFTANPDSVLRVMIHRMVKDVRWTQKWIADAEAGRGRLRYSPREAKQLSKEQRPLIDAKNAEIKQFEKWMGRLKPYLIRGVGFNEESFSGLIVPKGLRLDFGGAFEVKGVLRLAMKKMPAVAYLPYKPPRVYTEMGLMD
jgi:hypothetical protein